VKVFGFNNLYLVWRRGQGQPYNVIGVIKKDKNCGTYSFKYLITKDEADKIGFDSYVAFPDLQKTYSNYVLDIFGMRLNNPKRSDIQQYYEFWEVEPQYQCKEQSRYMKLFLLARTQGLLTTDNFEFLADYNITKKLLFISEICELNEVPPEVRVRPDQIAEGDQLEWKCNSLSKQGECAVEVYKDRNFLGYVKTIHSRVFYKKGSDSLNIAVKTIDRSQDKINRIFIKVYM
jgi:hypothetical protein